MSTTTRQSSRRSKGKPLRFRDDEESESKDSKKPGECNVASMIPPALPPLEILPSESVEEDSEEGQTTEDSNLGVLALAAEVVAMAAKRPADKSSSQTTANNKRKRAPAKKQPAKNNKSPPSTKQPTSNKRKREALVADEDNTNNDDDENSQNKDLSSKSTDWKNTKRHAPHQIVPTKPTAKAECANVMVVYAHLQTVPTPLSIEAYV